ncbi:methyltransferase domain-containing protein [uncultured Gelidibacter sp.]|uniref:class I SAM-dependent methyltransferase n=1 Tax=uncultured Gelidibacter sp. TaxID=259318 RepID=UPI002619CE20|nr:methyltransferase domain-containing protein [uncultured Gelidibacter sp.]
MSNKKRLKQKLKTSLEFSKNLFVTGAITETSPKVELEICRHIPRNRDVIIVEFGMGHGNITKAILNKISPNSKLYSFEVNKEFCDYVRKSIPDERLEIITDGAENMSKLINEKIDGIISSIPFSFFSKEKGMSIIQNAYDSLSTEAYYSQVLYTKFNFKKFQMIFDVCEIKKFYGIPTEYIYHCQKK